MSAEYKRLKMLDRLAAERELQAVEARAPLAHAELGAKFIAEMVGRRMEDLTHEEMMTYGTVALFTLIELLAKRRGK